LTSASPPAEKTAARQDEAGQSGTGDWTWNPGLPGQAYIVYKKAMRRELSWQR